MANDPLQSAWTKATAFIPKNGERLTADDVNVVLEDAYVPKYKLQNSALRNWFTETDSWWFDNLRQNIERLQTPVLPRTRFDIGDRDRRLCAFFH